MIRLLLTLLALVSGLTASGTAGAHAYAETPVAIAGLAATGGAAKSLPHGEAHAAALAATLASAIIPGARALPSRALPSVVYAPAVRTGIDRARE